MKKSKKKPNKTRPDMHPGGLSPGDNTMIFFHKRLTIALCLLSLAAAVGGLHLGYVGGDANRYLIQDHAAGIVRLYQLFTAYGFPIPYQLQVYNQFFADTGWLLLFAAVLDNPYAAVHLHAILCMVIMALSCLLLTRRLGGKNMSWLALPAVGLMALLIINDSSEELFVTMVTTVFRNGLLALQPMLLWLSVCVLFAATRQELKRGAIALFALLFFLHMSYYILLVWFVVPVVLAVLLAMHQRWLPWQSPNWKVFAAVMVLSYLAAKILREPVLQLFFTGIGGNEQAVGISLSLPGILNSAQLFFEWVFSAVTRMPVLAAVWAGFIVLAGCAVGQGMRAGKKQESAIYFTMFFVLLTVAISPAAAIITGKFTIWGRLEHFANHRYFEPSVYWPLFLGWPILLGYFLSRWRARFPRIEHIAGRAVMVFAAVVFLFALPLFRHLSQLGVLNNYSSSFLECAEINAEKYSLKQGLANVDFAAYLTAHGTTAKGTMKALGVLNIRSLNEAYGRPHDLKTSPFSIHSPATGTTGLTPDEYNYIVINETEAARRQTPPEVTRCPGRLQNPQQCFDEGKWGWIGYHFIDHKTVVDYYGAPDNQFRCEGVDFYVYNDGLKPGK